MAKKKRKHTKHDTPMRLGVVLDEQTAKALADATKKLGGPWTWSSTARVALALGLACGVEQIRACQ